jgi:hypothetical protein
VTEIPGVALQRFTLIREDGTAHNYSYPGTEEEARLYGQLLTMHDTHPDHAATLAQFNKLRNARLAATT